MTNETEIVGTHEIRRRYGSGERDFRNLEIHDGGDAASLRGALLEGADFGGSFILADFTNASLRGCKFVDTNVKTCAFDAADLRYCDFSRAAIDSATFGRARLDESCFAGATAFGYTLKPAERPDW